MGHDLAFIGANPAALLYDGDRASAFVSVWQGDWSTQGAGGAGGLCRPGGRRGPGGPPPGGRWVFGTLVTPFGGPNHFEDPPAPPTGGQAPTKNNGDPL